MIGAPICLKLRQSGRQYFAMRVCRTGALQKCAALSADGVFADEQRLPVKLMVYKHVGLAVENLGGV